MRLQHDPHSVIYDTAAQVASVVDSFVRISAHGRTTIENAIIRYCANDVEMVQQAQLYARMVYQRVNSDPGFNPVTALMYGMTPPDTPAGVNLFEFVSHLPGDNITDIRTEDGASLPGMALDIGSTVPVEDLDRFTPDKHEPARKLLHSLAHVISEDMGIEGRFLLGSGVRSATDVPDPTILVSSGLLPTLIHTVNEMGDAMDMPGELLITLLHDDLIAGLPDVGIYGRYLEKHRNNALSAS